MRFEPFMIAGKKRIIGAMLLAAAICCATLRVSAQTAAPTKTASSQKGDAAAQLAKLFEGMQWRLVGPFRGGRALSAEGVPGQPSIFYFGSVGGGVWKTTDAGMSWQPIFDSQPIASIGAVAVAPSDANVIYVGSGEADMRSAIGYGNGVYRSDDAGKTWRHIGLDDTRQIGKILIDTKNADIAYVAALGHAYGPNPQRGVFKTVDGGKTWKMVLFKDENTGAIDMAFDPRDSKTIYASLWQTRRPPWSVYPPSNGPGSGLYKSTDSGEHWQQLTNGIPTVGLGKIGIAVAPSDPNRVYLVVDSKDGGLYRSDDAGQSFRRMDFERRIWGRGWYFGGVTVDPKNADVLYISNTSIYKSADGGKTFTAFKGAPGGDDYHSLWISPDDSGRMITASDQGTVVTVNGGKTWSSWYNQPTGQMYHGITDNRFPYWIYGAQQDSGAIAVPSRSDYGSITERDWRPVSVGGESDMIAPDPKDGGIVFGGRVTRFDWATMTDQDVSPGIGKEENERATWTLPIVFSKADPKRLYFSDQQIHLSVDSGHSWTTISPDLTRPAPGVPGTLDPITAKYGLDSPRKGVVYSLAPSPKNANLLWAGTDDGLIHVTRDNGAHWSDVTPAALTSWSKVTMLEASHFDESTAYAAVDRHRLEDLAPYIYRTHDGGKSWQCITRGIPSGSFVNAVREDPLQRGLLYAGTELGVYVSFNDGDEWQPLQLNLPVTSVRDLDPRADDLVVATHGRAFWILDDIAPLREIADIFASSTTPADTFAKILAGEGAHLFKPQVALRIRPGHEEGTPYPPEIPHGVNPPPGAIIDYFLANDSATPVTLEVFDAQQRLVRTYSSADKPPVVHEKALPIPMYWIKPAKTLSAGAGGHRFVWDLRYASAVPPSLMNTVFGRSSGVWALPGEYSVRLTAGGTTLTQPLTVKMDPRVTASTADLQQQFNADMEVAQMSAALAPVVKQATAVRKQWTELLGKDASLATTPFGKRLNDIGGKEVDYGATITPLRTDFHSIAYLSSALEELQSAIESADAAPTREQTDAIARLQPKVAQTSREWQDFIASDLPKMNEQLRSKGLAEIKLEVPK